MLGRLREALSLPLRHRAHTWAAAFALTAYYMATACRDLAVYDSPELAMVAVQLGVGHPIGQPLHTMVGHAAGGLTTMLGMGALAGVAWVSSVALGLCIVPVTSLLDQWAPHIGGKRLRALNTPNAEGEAKAAESDEDAANDETTEADDASADAAGDGTAGDVADADEATEAAEAPTESVPRTPAEDVLPKTTAWRPWALALIGLHSALWEPATRIEVYPLATLLVLLAAAYATRAFEGVRTEEGETRSDKAGWLLAGLTLGLASGANAMIALFMGVCLLPPLFRAARAGRLGGVGFGLGLLGTLVGLLVWFYVPWAGANPDVVTWNDTATHEGLVRYLTGADYADKGTAVGGAVFIEHVLAFFAWAFDGGIIFLLGLGFVGLFRSLRGLALAVPLFILCAGWYARYDPFAPGYLDYLGYLATPTLLFAAGVVLTVEWGFVEGQRGGVLVTLIVLGVVLTAPPHPFGRNRNHTSLSRILAEATLEELPQNAVLIADMDHWAMPLWYLLEIEHRRDDVVLLLYGQANSSWYWRYLYRRHPDLRHFNVSIEGEDSRAARVRRFIQTQQRPVFMMHRALGDQAGLGGCVVGMTIAVHRGAPCGPDTLAELVRERIDHPAYDAPGEREAGYFILESRGRDLLREGRLQDAVAVLIGDGMADLPHPFPEQFGRPVVAPPQAAFDEPSGLGSARVTLTMAAWLAQELELDENRDYLLHLVGLFGRD